MAFAKGEIEVGTVYRVRLHGKFTDVKVDSIDEVVARRVVNFGMTVKMTHRTVYNCTNQTTGRQVVIKSAAKFRRIVSPTTIAQEIASDA